MWFLIFIIIFVLTLSQSISVVRMRTIGFARFFFFQTNVFICWCPHAYEVDTIFSNWKKRRLEFCESNSQILIATTTYQYLPVVLLL